MASDDDFNITESDDESEFDMEPTIKEGGKGKRGKKRNAKDAGVSSSQEVSMSGTAEQVEAGMSKKRHSMTVEEKYQKMTQREHIIKRPDTYIGSIEKLTQEMWVYDSIKKGLVYRNITYVPGFYKIFDEILVNAADNKQTDPSMDTIRVKIDREEGRITVWNNGKGIPVVIHKDYNCYVPSLIFGQLLTGGNFNDNEKKGGRNGYGAKLTNIYSTEFTVETADSKEGKLFHQTWHDNMSRADEPVIKKHKGKEYTMVSYKPDLSLFKMDGFDDDIVDLMIKRVYDMAGVTDSSLKVYLNDKRVEVKNFEQYIKMYQMESTNANTKENKIAYCKAGDRWEIGVGVSDGHLQQVSFVNSICTSKGGKHIDYIAQKITDYLVPVLKKKAKKEIKPMMIKQYLYIFCNCQIENPAFDSQTKETLTTVSKNFGSLPTLSEEFLKKVSKCGIVESVVSFSRFKEDQKLKKQSGTKTARKLNIPKLDDANFAGTRQSKDCTLIITEGDSAKSLVIGGLSIIGRDYYGVFPLRGKMLNVRDVSRSAVIGNEEIKNLVQILGLKFDTVYKDVSSLRYGKLVIMADQDYDGSHIKGLVINFIHYFWPSLLKIGFLQQFITPIVKATRGKKSFMFFTLQQYRSWLDDHNQGKGYYIKYYKGLGTSTPLEGKEYFSNLPRHLVPFGPITDNESSEIDMVFRKNRVEERKDWISSYVSGDGVDYAVDQMAYKDFLDKELILFSRYDNIRSIPCIIDGLKPSQRKVLFGAFERKLTSEIKVVQFSGYVSEHASYHHGEQSLNSTIISMAQDYVGANNINLLVPSGQFGTRLMGGKDAASPRYIYTYLSKITRLIFKEEDDMLCRYLVDEGQSIEPDFYLPIVPMVLINGSEGIGTGYSTTIPNYNPIDIVNYIKAKLNDQPLPELHPWWRGFTGDIYKIPKGYLIRGRITKLDDLTYVITELPVGRWTQDYKKFLTELALPEKKAPVIADFKENHTDTTVHFTVILTQEQANALAGQDLYKVFKLETTITTSNFNLFDENGHIHHYANPQEVINAFFDYRYPLYQKRKDYLVSKLEKETLRLSNMARFILAVVNKELIINNRPLKDVIKDLVDMKFDPQYPENKKTQAANGDIVVHKEKADELGDNYDDTTKSLAKGYQYLLSMKIWSLTKEKVDELKKKLDQMKQELDELKATSPKTMWETDLDVFVNELFEMEKKRIKEKDMEEKNRRRAQNRHIAGRAGRTNRTNTSRMSIEGNDDSSDFDDDDDQPRRTRRPKVTPAPRLTAKEKAMDELTKRANDIRSRFSISSYYKSQVKEPTEELLKRANATIDPVTGEVIKKTKTRKVKTEVKTEEKEKKGGKRGKKKVDKDDEISMILESDDEEEEEDINLESDDEDDDVIRDNKAAIAERRKEIEKEKEKEKEIETNVEIKKEEDMEVEEEKSKPKPKPKPKPKRAPRKKTVKNDDDEEEETEMKEGDDEIEIKKEEDMEVEEEKSKSKPKSKPKRAPRKKTVKKDDDDDDDDDEEEEEKPKPKGRRKAAAKETSKVESVQSIESDDDHYIPLAERLKMKMNNDTSSSLVDDLINTKTVVPTNRRRKPAATKKKETVTKRKAKKVDSDDSSDDSLFGF